MTNFLFRLKARVLLTFLRIRGYSFKEASKNSGYMEASRLRYKVYAEEQYIDTNINKEGVLLDKYSEFSRDFVAFHKNKVIGAIRVTSDSKFGFPTENLFNIKRVDRRANTAEIGRLVIDEHYRKKSINQRSIMFGLAYMIYNFSLKNGVDFWICNMPEKLAESFKDFGARLEEIYQDPPTIQNIEARSLIAGYFKRYNLLPYIINVRNINAKGSIL